MQCLKMPLSEVTQDHWTWHYSVDSLWFPNSVLYDIIGPKTYRFWDNGLVSIVTLKPGLGSPKVIENYTIQSGTHDFRLTFRSNHRPISHHYRDKRRFPSKIANFSHTPCILRPCWRGYLWNWVSAHGSEKLGWWGYRMVKKVLR